MSLRKMILIGCTMTLPACTSPPTHAKPTAPVNISYEHSTTLPTDETINTTIHVTATQALQSLTVVIKPSEQINMVDGKLEYHFTAIKRGEIKKIPLTLQITDNNTGYLAVFATTKTPYGTRIRSAKLSFGETNPLSNQANQKQNNAISTTINHEKVIRMQGDRR